MRDLCLSAIAGGLFVSLSLAANANTVVVPGTSDPWLAGQPTGASASLGDGVGDYAPAQSPVYAGSVTPGATITWSASGLVGNGPTETQFGPNGDTTGSLYGLFSHDAEIG